jgi:hypothetical protein
MNGLCTGYVCDTIDSVATHTSDLRRSTIAMIMSQMDKWMTVSDGWCVFSVLFLDYGVIRVAPNNFVELSPTWKIIEHRGGSFLFF